jgi:hypothetical protein
LLLPLGILAGIPLFAGPVTLCFENPAKLDADTIRQFQRELAVISRASAIELRVAPCGSGDSDLRITLERVSAVEATALGAAKTVRGRVIAEFEVYSERIAAMLPARLPNLMGRAMARVAAHELGHFFLQTSEHGSGVMTEVFTPARLLVNDHRSFLIPRAREASSSFPCGSE